MPYAPKKICPVCKRVGCTQHRNDKFRNKVRHQFSDFYHTPKWRATRKLYLKENPICVQCYTDGRMTPANVVDHITPIREGGHLTDPDNLQSLCSSCHNKKTAIETHRKKR